MRVVTTDAHEIELDTTLAQAEVLFVTFRAVVEEIDNENAEAGEEHPSSGDLRHRRRASTGPSSIGDSWASSTTTGSGTRRRTISPEVRDLLNSWRPEFAEPGPEAPKREPTEAQEPPADVPALETQAPVPETTAEGSKTTKPVYPDLL